MRKSQIRRYEGTVDVRLDIKGIADLVLTVQYNGYDDPGVLDALPEHCYPPEGDLEWEVLKGAIEMWDGNRIELDDGILESIDLSKEDKKKIEETIMREV